MMCTQVKDVRETQGTSDLQNQAEEMPDTKESIDT
jgi:hypothetical protein